MIGALLVAGACINGVATVFFLSRAVRTTGIVIDPGPGGRHPIVRYRLPSGAPAELVGGGIFAAVRTGAAVPVIYDPANPVRSAVIDGVAPIWFLTVLSALIGSGLILVSATTRR